jgi:hypothetical protein
MQSTATKKTNYTKRETRVTWTGAPDSINEEGSLWAGQVEITFHHNKDRKEFVAYARYALTKTERGFDVTHFAMFDQTNYPNTRFTTKSAPRYSDKALDLFTDEVMASLGTLAEGNPTLTRLLVMAEGLTK